MKRLFIVLLGISLTVTSRYAQAAPLQLRLPIWVQVNSSRQFSARKVGFECRARIANREQLLNNFSVYYGTAVTGEHYAGANKVARHTLNRVSGNDVGVELRVGDSNDSQNSLDITINGEKRTEYFIWEDRVEIHEPRISFNTVDVTCRFRLVLVPEACQNSLVYSDEKQACLLGNIPDALAVEACSRQPYAEERKACVSSRLEASAIYECGRFSYGEERVACFRRAQSAAYKAACRNFSYSAERVACLLSGNN